MAWPGARQTYGAIARSSGYADPDLGFWTPDTAPTDHVIPTPNLSLLEPGLSVGPAAGVPRPSSALGAFTLGLSTLGTSRPPATQAFFRDAELTAGTISPRPGYLAGRVPDRLGHVPTGPHDTGGFAIGRSAIGHRRGWHGTITTGATPGQGETETPPG